MMDDEMQQGREVEPRSSVRVATTAKGEPTLEVKAYTNDLALLDETLDKVITVYRRGSTELGI